MVFQAPTFVFVLLAAIIVRSVVSVSVDPLIVETAEGTIRGHYTPAGIREWKGKCIPYKIYESRITPQKIIFI